jgi:hypothetical protein
MERLLPYQPKAYFNGIPQYSSWEVDIFGPPHEYGVELYIVLETPQYCSDRILTQDDYDRPNSNTKPKHEYNREQRFKSTLRQLLGGCRDQIPNEILHCFQNGDVNWHKDHVWNSIRNILKKHKKITCYKGDESKIVSTKKYYNRIPEILIHHYYKHRIKLPKIDYEEMYRYFKCMHHKFNEITYERNKHRLTHNQAQKDCPICDKRAYFPNLRFIILKLLQQAGTEFEYHIPILRTKRKIPVLDRVWNELTSEINIVYY